MDESILGPLKPDGNLNLKAFQNVLSCLFRNNIPQNVGLFANNMGFGLDMVDNSAMYAKLCHNWMVAAADADLAAALAPAAGAYAAGCVLIDVSVAPGAVLNEAINAFAGHHAAGSFIFIENTDFVRGEEGFCYQLATTTQLYAPASPAHVFVGCCWTWPAIPVVLVYNTPGVALPAVPQFERYPIAQLKAFAYNLAARRKELAHLAVGIHMAASIVAGEWLRFTYDEEHVPQGFGGGNLAAQPEDDENNVGGAYIWVPSTSPLSRIRLGAGCCYLGQYISSYWSVCKDCSLIGL